MQDKSLGCLYGTAIGDAIGAPVEFNDYAFIRARYPHDDALQLVGTPARVTDDTQMMLAVGKAVVQAPRPFQPDTLTPLINQHFSNWYSDPQNNRAPGVTCMTSIEKVINGQTWEQATNISSKGCGANMRVQPVGLLALTAQERAAIAQFQAAVTHGHPTGLTAADVTAWVIAELMNDGDTTTLSQRIRTYIESQRRVYHQQWLGNLYQRPIVFASGEDFIEHGWNECLTVLDKVDSALDAHPYNTDPADLVGEGWVAEEAFGVALYSFLRYLDAPLTAIRHAAITRGDSDSTACITGAFVGALHGTSAFPDDWIQRLEYHAELTTLGEALAAP